MLHLRRPDEALHTQWLVMAEEFAIHHSTFHGAGLGDRERIASFADPEVFADWVARTAAEEDPGTPMPDNWAHSTLRWVMDDDRMVGSIHLRHTLSTDFLRRYGGHIGYGVRPSARRRGVATGALGLMLSEAARLGIDPVLITCETGNEASSRTALANGARHEGTLDGYERYWIALGDGR